MNNEVADDDLADLAEWWSDDDTAAAAGATVGCFAAVNGSLPTGRAAAATIAAGHFCPRVLRSLAGVESSLAQPVHAGMSAAQFSAAFVARIVRGIT